VVGSVDKDAYRIGRNPETCDFCVSDRFVNPVHAVITRQGADYAITDKCSRNGTFVDGTRLEPENPFPLYGNEEIRIGKEVFRFMITSD
jgi:pSer/pThr/pTyr-binding forkhead associated (FHA) protein